MRTLKLKSRMLKILTTSILIISILCSSVGVQAMVLIDGSSFTLANFKRGSIVYQPNLTFSDIGDAILGDKVPWYRDSIRKAYVYGIIVGKELNLFDPDGYLTIAEAITIGARMHAIYKYGDTSKIDGYAGSEWYSKYLNYYRAENLIDDAFNNMMNMPIKRSEMVFIWSKIFEEKDLEGLNEVVYENINDIDMSTLYSSEVLKFYQVGITVGYPDGSFLPNNNIIRAEATAIFLRLIEPKERQKKDFTVVNNNGGVVIPVREYTDKFEVITHGNVSGVPLGGQAEPVDLSSHTALLQTVKNGVPLWGGMNDKLADDLMRSIMKTIRLEVTEDYQVFLNISIPELPEGFGLIQDFSLFFGNVGTSTYYKEFGYDSAGLAIIASGNYRFSMKSNRVELEQRIEYYKKITELSFTLGLCYAYKTPGVAWATEAGNYSGALYDLLTSNPKVSRYAAEYIDNKVFDYWNGLM